MQALAIGDAIFTKSQQRVLGLLYGKPDQRFFTNKIVRWAAMGRGTITRELERLVSAGVLVVSVEGNQHYYQANPDTAIYTELLGIVRKTFGVADVIRDALKPLDAQMTLAFVYGSIAKGDAANNSDVDLMLVGDDLVYGDVVELLLPLEASLQRPVNPTLYSRDDFAAKLADANSFLVRVMEQPKLMIKGIIDDVGKPD